MTDFAYRAYSHNYKIDPIVRTLMDTDMYKLLMLQFIWKRYRGVPVTFKMINRSKTIKLGNLFTEQELREQLDHVRTLRFKPNELIWLAGNTFYGVKGIFCSEFIEFLRGIQLPEYDLTRLPDGEYEITFSGPWELVTLWEIHGMEVVNTLRNRAGLKQLGRFQLTRIYNEATHRLFTKMDLMAKHGVTGLAEFGTRRRHDFLWQEFVIEAMTEIMGPGFIGTSNAFLAMKHGLPAIGTNAHELPMVLATLANTDEELKWSQYRVLQEWQEEYQGNLKVFLPDTFGTTQFLEGAPDWVADWAGARLDSKDPYEGGQEVIDFFVSRDRDPMTKRLLPSDGLTAEVICGLKESFTGNVGRIGYGMGTMATNDFPAPIAPISLVCKVTEANGRPAVKLSDNAAKRTGPKEEVARYVRVFGTKGVENAPVVV
jgi:nicotinate phosphoribosyltransferase